MNISDVNKIVEDYVSNESFELMKQNGFAGWFPRKFHDDGRLKSEIITIDKPPLSVAMSWIRKKYNIAIEPYISASGWDCTFSKIPTGSNITSLYNEISIKSDQEMTRFFSTYDSACDAAIKFTLEYLIQFKGDYKRYVVR